MASKYASLPDIDTAPDVYETPDVTESFGLVGKSPFDEEEEDNKQIDRSTLSATDAVTRFRDKTQDDPKFALQTRKRALYRSYLSLNTAPGESIATGDYEVLPREPALQETPVQKLRRLMFEVQELGEEMTELAQPSGEEEGAIQHSVILAQVNTLRYELDTISQRISLPTSDETNDKDSILLKQNESSRRLLARLQKISQENSNGLDTVIPHVELAKDQEDDVDGLRAAQLESRLAALERLVGHERNIEAEPTDAIAPVIAKMEQQLELLAQPRHMELVARRAKALTHELERLQRYKAEDDERLGINKETAKKIDQLFSTLDQLDPLIPLAPALVQRLKNLEQLHARAATFSDAVTAVEREQTRLDGSINGMEEQCTKIETSLKENGAIIQRNVEALDRRIADLVERVAKLGVH
ncbi:Dynamitin-domain-containing protein [Syncephalis fuscata]|nr:Dynamitin-domain-containing protein [Syncephalis fuscata]